MTMTRTDHGVWQVTGPQKASPHGSRRPWGTVHARRNGTHTTACGRSTITWYVFWNLRFVPGAKDMCWTCSTVIGQVDDAR